MWKTECLYLKLKYLRVIELRTTSFFIEMLIFALGYEFVYTEIWIKLLFVCVGKFMKRIIESIKTSSRIITYYDFFEIRVPLVFISSIRKLMENVERKKTDGSKPTIFHHPETALINVQFLWSINVN